jgi:hypothetical protein
MRREGRQTPRLVKKSGNGRAHADCPGALNVVHQRALRIDGVGDPGEAVNVENADRSPVAQEMTPTMP